MLSFTGGLKVFVALDPIDMRKGFEGLHAAVTDQINAFGTIAIASSTLEILMPSRIAMISGAFPLAKRG